MARKKRVRAHIIEDLSTNHVERIILRCGHTAERVQRDYGYDLLLHTYNYNQHGEGETENGFAYLQLKATESPKYSQDEQVISFDVDTKDLDLWYNEVYPVILIVFDANKDTAYFVHIQAYLKQSGMNRFSLLQKIRAQDTLRVNMNTQKTFDENTVGMIRDMKNKHHEKLNEKLNELGGVIE